jgi:class 3 adenylate cyclase/TolB-like protein/Tfp pilus assembly protein PilF
LAESLIVRRLAAILHADVAGYSKLMGRDEESTVAAIRTQQVIVSDVASTHRGRIADFTGDSFLAEFGSAIDAVHAALAIQSAGDTLNRDKPSEAHFRLRIGVHLGEVRVEGERIFGDTIHVAARLQTLAPAGGICMSAAVRDQLTGKLDLEVADIGLQPLKHIDRPVHAFIHPVPATGLRTGLKATLAPDKTSNTTRISRRVLLSGVASALLASGAAYVFLVRRPGLTPAFGSGIAVLPFRNLGGDTADDWFPEGIASEIRSTLARSEHFRVLATPSSRRFDDESLDAVSLASRLGVAWLLDGSVRRGSDNQVRINADLINGGDGFNLWSESFQRTLDDVFAIQGEIAAAVVRELSRLATGEDNPAWVVPDAVGGTTSAAAYQAWLRGRALYDKAADEADEKLALEQFETAIGLDPDYALAHASRARSLIVLANHDESIEQRREQFRSALAAARRAIDLAPDLAQAHALEGLAILEGQLNVSAAGDAFMRSLRLGSRDAAVLGTYATWAICAGRLDEALDAAQRARDLDPLNPLVHAAIGDAWYAKRNYAEAISHYGKTLAANPGTAIAHYAIGKCEYLLGNLDAARQSFAAETADHARLTGLALIDAKQGGDEASDTHLEALIEGYGDSMLYQQAMILTQRGTSDDALSRLESARLLDDSGLPGLASEPLFDALRTHPRFLILLKSLGLQ